METTLEPTKKRAIISAATDLMLDRGYVATTVDEICARAEVTKGSFFYYFKNKEDLGKALLRAFGQQQWEAVEGLFAGVDDPLDRIRAYLDWITTVSAECSSKGCLIGTLTQELHESHPEIRAVCHETLERLADRFTAELAAARDRYAPDRDLDVRGLAESLLALTQGALILIKAHGDRQVMERTLAHYRHYLEGLLGV